MDSQDLNRGPGLDQSKDVLYLEDYFFIKAESLKKKTAIVEKTVDDLYRYVSYN
jgi:hypothetical protein